MRDKFNQHIAEGMSYDQAKVQTIADMHKLVTEMPMNEITPIVDGSGKNRHLGNQGFTRLDGGDNTKQEVVTEVPTEVEVKDKNSNTRNNANKTTNTTNQKTSEHNQPIVKPTTLASITNNAVEQAKAGKVTTWGSGK